MRVTLGRARSAVALGLALFLTIRLARLTALRRITQGIELFSEFIDLPLYVTVTGMRGRRGVTRLVVAGCTMCNRLMARPVARSRVARGRVAMQRREISPKARDFILYVIVQHHQRRGRGIRRMMGATVRMGVTVWLRLVMTGRSVVLGSRQGCHCGRCCSGNRGGIMIVT